MNVKPISINMPENKLKIADRWIQGDSESFQSTCPVDNSVVWEGNAASDAQVDQAFLAARNAFGGWWDRSSTERIGIAERFAELVRESADELALLIARETGKPLWETKTEAGAVAAKVDLSIDAFRTRRDTTSFELGAMQAVTRYKPCLLYTSPSPRDRQKSRMPSSA